MIKVKIGDYSSFANQILSLLHNSKKRLTIAQEGVSFVTTSATWELRSKQVLQQLKI
jgi:hypothetical protein